MQTLTDIIEKLFPIVNVTSVTSTLNGGEVYRYSKPDDSQEQDVVILGLPITNDEDPITQSATIIINCFAVNHTNGMADDVKITATIDAITAVLLAYTSGSSEYFEFVIQNQSIIKDIDDVSMSYGSLRVRCTIET